MIEQGKYACQGDSCREQQQKRRKIWRAIIGNILKKIWYIQEETNYLWWLGNNSDD